MKLVLGGGLGGLSSAYYLGRKGAQVALVEKSNRLGGWVKTDRDPATGVLCETGPHTVRPAGVAGHNTLSLLSELGQRTEDLVVIKRDHPAARKRLICLNSILYPLPSVSAILKPTPPFTKPFLFAFLKDFIMPRNKAKDESAYDFVSRRFSRELADYAISPMLCGICAGDAKEISVKSLLPLIYKAEQTHGSVIRGFISDIFNPSAKLKPPPEFEDSSTWSVWTHKKGLSFIIDLLRDRIIHQGGSIRLSSTVSNLYFKENQVTCDIDGSKYEFTHLVSSLPSKSLAPLVASQHPDLSSLLSEIPFATVAVVNLVFEGELLKEKAFGFLVPPSENQSLLGIIYDSCIFSQGNYTLFTAMLGGRWYDKYFTPSTTENEIKDLTLSYIRQILSIDQAPLTCKVSILKDCIPQYTLGHSERIEKIDDYIKKNNLPLSLVGSSYEGIGVNDVILSAKNAVDRLIHHNS